MDAGAHAEAHTQDNQDRQPVEQRGLDGMEQTAWAGGQLSGQVGRQQWLFMTDEAAFLGPERAAVVL